MRKMIEKNSVGFKLSVSDKIHVFSDTPVMSGSFNKSVGSNGFTFVSPQIQT